MAEFDPDAALAEMGEFLTGHRTVAGYARFADTVRALHNHISGGGVLPGRWARGRVVTIEHWGPGGLKHECQAPVQEEYRTALPGGDLNWMVVKPGEPDG